MHERRKRVLVRLAALSLASSACAGKQPTAAAPTAEPPPEVHNERAEEPRPVRDPFELDEASDDPAAALEGLKHDCCEAMPEDEVRRHVDSAPSK
jgi:hypothetical protein